MIIDTEINYSNQEEVLDILDKIDSTIRSIGMKKSFIAKEVGENQATYSRLISAVDGYVSEARIRKYCNYLNDRFE